MQGLFSYDLNLKHGDEHVSGSDYLALEGSARPRREGRIRFASFPRQLLKGEVASASVTFENTGLEPWEKPTLVGLAGTGQASSAFASGSWKKTGVAGSDERTDQDELSNFVFDLTTPTTVGTVATRFFLKTGRRQSHSS